MNKEHDTEEDSENEDEGGYAFSSEMLGKQKIVKHNSSINLSESSISNSLPVVVGATGDKQNTLTSIKGPRQRPRPGRVFWNKIRKGKRAPMPLGAMGDNTKSPRHL